ncbi:S66 peptidase family protein [Phormidium tenue]|uniref:LD-carboxypeptidase n=1 Tax=Phormidium tenue NIES-30 TaxID=549789 RepID=A0A1U7J7V7_9CYAN|nr:LD-carboxypeptidase [Phormidium tenue]MBD2231431.1 LD-carboxypeptidase [Phormidium tenue FACHB-1052]OKH49169.1 LD-carboxypeptidase [Phormidium tenue NIES-30]
MRRRQLLGGLGVAAAGVALGQRAVQAQGRPILLPPRLRAGDTVGIISPAGATFERDRLDLVIDAVKALGFVPRVAPHALARYGYLAGTDAERAADVNAMFADPAVKALLPIRGDWGSARILPYLNYDLIRANPKVVIGFSDISALLLGLYAQTGLVTFHGPHGLTAWRDDQVEPLRRILINGEMLTYTNPLLGGDQDRLMRDQGRIQTMTPGRATGPLLGGNLSVISGIVGSPYMPDTTGAILFLEDVGEAPYSIDRMLTQLKLAGVLDGLAGFVFGQCTGCGPGEGYGSLTLSDILQDHIKPLGIPAYAGAWIGHIEPLWTLPIGGSVTMDATVGSLQMQAPAVS